MSAHEHWQMDASAPELYERYLVPAIIPYGPMIRSTASRRAKGKAC